MVNLGVLVFVILKTKTPQYIYTKPMRKIYMKLNYNRSKTIIRKTTKTYLLSTGRQWRNISKCTHQQILL